jgi:hypothetical protein
MQRRMIDALETIPGVKSVGLVKWPPLGGGGSTEMFHRPNDRSEAIECRCNVQVFNISPEYFHAAGTACWPAEPSLA